MTHVGQARAGSRAGRAAHGRGRSEDHERGHAVEPGEANRPRQAGATTAGRTTGGTTGLPATGLLLVAPANPW